MAQAIVPGTLEMLILKSLTKGPDHGYGIARRIEEASGRGILVEEGSLYPALHRVQRRGWIAATWGASDSISYNVIRCPWRDISAAAVRAPLPPPRMVIFLCMRTSSRAS